MDKFDELEALIAETKNDAKKTFEKNNKAASVRLRKSMQHLKELANDVRKECLEIRTK